MNEVSAVEFGRVLGRLESLSEQIAKMEERIVWRQDDLERRVERLENSTSGVKPLLSIWTKVVAGVITAAITAAFVAKTMGI